MRHEFRTYIFPAEHCPEHRAASVPLQLLPIVPSLPWKSDTRVHSAISDLGNQSRTPFIAPWSNSDALLPFVAIPLVVDRSQHRFSDGSAATQTHSQQAVIVCSDSSLSKPALTFLAVCAERARHHFPHTSESLECLSSVPTICPPSLEHFW